MASGTTSRGECETGKYTILDAETRNTGTEPSVNVLLIGRSQVGKSTIIKVLLDPSYNVEARGFSDTTEPACRQLAVRNNESNACYRLNIIDTPGLGESMQHVEPRSNVELMRLMGQFLALNISALNAVCFVSRASKTHLHDINIFNQIMDYFGREFSTISMMVLTHCDEFRPSDIDKFEKNIQQHSATSRIYNYCSLGLKRFGAINVQTIQAFQEDLYDDDLPSDRQTKQPKSKNLKNIRAMRDALVDAWITTIGKAVPTAVLHNKLQHTTRHIEHYNQTANPLTSSASMSKTRTVTNETVPSTSLAKQPQDVEHHKKKSTSSHPRSNDSINKRQLANATNSQVHGEIVTERTPQYVITSSSNPHSEIKPNKKKSRRRPKKCTML